MGRVTVKFPWLNPDLSSSWARVVGVGAGVDRGMYWLPEINDEVLVAFEQGDISRPIVIGGLWNGEDAPPIPASTAISNGAVQQRVLVTRAGHKITLAEENPGFVRVETAGGHTLVLHDDDGKVEIKTAGNTILALDDNSNKITIKGPGDVEIEAGLNASIKANGNMEIEASGNLTIKGAMIQLNP